MSLNEDVIGRVELVWKIDIFRSELSSDFIDFNWPRTEHTFSLGFSFHGENKQLVLFKNEQSPFILSGTISAVTAEKSEYVLWQFENLKFSKKCDTYEQMFSNDSLISYKTLTLRTRLWNPCMKDSNIPTYFAHFHNKSQTCSFPWIIKKDCFSRQVIEVPRDFHYSDDNVYNLLLTLKTVNDSSTEDETSKFNMELKITFKNPLKIRFSKIICLKCKIEAITGEGITLPVIPAQKISLDSECGLSLLIDANLFSEMNANISAKNITLHCHISANITSMIGLENVSYLSDSENSSVQDNKSGGRERTGKETSSKETLKDCMYGLYKEGKFCDVILATQEKKFPCHKNVLCCRSSVFRAMFENDMKEKESGLIDVIDADPETLGLFLTALYTDKIEDLNWKNAMNVYIIADKYDVELIRKQCTDYLASNLSSSKVCDLLELADSHQDENLKDSAEKFFFSHAKEIIKSSHWTTLMSKNIELAALMMQKAFTISD